MAVGNEAIGNNRAISHDEASGGSEAAGNGGEIRIGVRELRGNLTRYLQDARQGTCILVTSHDAVIAEIHPPSVSLRSARQFGALRGRIVMADDFDTLPDDILAAMEQ